MTVPDSVAVQLYQIDLEDPAPAPTWDGSPASRVALTVEPVTAESEESAGAEAKLSLAGGVGAGAGGGAGAGFGMVAAPVKRRRLGEPVPGLVTTLVVAALLRAPATWPGSAVASRERTSAAAPATCGEAIEVPEIVLVAELDVYHAEVMPEPGAKMSTQLP